MTNAAIVQRPAARAERVSVGALLFFAISALLLFFGGYELLEHYVLAPRLDMRALHLLHIVRGMTASVLLAGFVAWYLIRQGVVAEREVVASSADRDERNREHVRWFIRMRWIAIGFSLALILIAVPVTGILSTDYLPRLLFWWGLLVVANAIFAWDLRSQSTDFDRRVITQVIVDLVVLTGLLNASGGVENPLSISYLFHVIIAGILLPKRKAIAVAAVASLTFSCLALGELFGILPHTTILLFPHAHILRAGHMHMAHAAHDGMFVAGRLVSFVGVMFLTAYFTTLVADRLRRSELSLEITARRAMLDRNHLEGVIDAAGLGIAMIRRDGTLAWANQRLTSWMRWAPWSAGAECRHDHAGGDAASCVACTAASTIESGAAGEREVAVPASGGALRYFRHVSAPVRDADGNIVEAVEVVEEVTARKALEAEALHAGRLAILGQLASGVAHEIGNPLASLQARLELMRRRDDPAFTRDSLGVVQAQIDRIGRIVRGVSHLSRNRREEWVSVDVNAVVSEALALVKLDTRAANVRFEEALQDALPPVRGVRDQLLQVVINLLLNAVEAMPDGGVLSVATRDHGGNVEIAIADSGAGIADEVRSHLFEPFFTTKREGTGLGLSICYTLVHAHGGTIEVTSEPGRGACFTMILPGRKGR